MDKTTYTLVALVLCLAMTESTHLIPDEENGGYIIVGDPIPIEDAPWQVSLINNDDKHFCGGAIISERYIITSGYCLVLKQPKDIRVRSGSIKRNKEGLLTDVKNIIRHDEFGERKPHHDIGLIELSKKLKFGPTRAQIDLYDPDITPFPDAGDLVQLTGWGYTGELSGKPSLKLLEANVAFYDYTTCKSIYHDDKSTCIGNREEHMASCNGDSGGPAVYEGTLFGIVSGVQGVPCPKPELTGSITRIIDFRDWIHTNAV